MFRLTFCWLLLAWTPASAAVLSIGNMSQQPVSFRISHPEQTAETIATLSPGEHQLFIVGQSPVITYTVGGQLIRYRLDPYTPYVFAPQGDSFGLQGIELAGKMPSNQAIPQKPPSDELFTIKLKLLVDDAEARARPAWEKALRERITTLSAILEKQCRTRLEIVGFDEWKSDPQAATPSALLKDFESQVSGSSDYLTVGFSSRSLANSPNGGNPAEMLILPGCLRGPSARHLLLRESFIRSESARLEMLLHELGHQLGAVHSPDLFTTMRVNVLDGRSDRREVRTGLDPLNLLVVGIWLEEMRGGKLRGPADLPEIQRERLKVLYKTLQHVNPKDTLASGYLRVLERKERAMPGERFELEAATAEPGDGGQNQKIPAAPGPERLRVPVGPDSGETMPQVGPVQPANPTDPRDQAIRSVVRAITNRAMQIRQMPIDERPRGDELAQEYLKVAAQTAMTAPALHRSAAFSVGIGIALDDSKVLRNNLMKSVSQVCVAVESDSEFAERVAYLNGPTMRYRRDLCQHFAVSAALTELLGKQQAESIGLAKELFDSQRTSGFSFADLCADYAGAELASRVKESPSLLEDFRDKLRVKQLLPSVADLPEGLTTKRFLAEFGGPEDARFQQTVTDIRQRITDLYRVKK